MRITRFQAVLRDRFQELSGELTLRVEGTDVSGSLEIGGQQSYFQGKMLRKNRYAAAIRLKTGVYEEDCDMLLRVREPGSIRGSIVGEWGSWSLEGSAVPEPPTGRGPGVERRTAGKLSAT